MQVTEVNDIKTYNLSHGKTIPEWLSDRKKRLLLKKDVDLRRRIQLIQDFEMPTVSNTVNISRDGQYIIATGIYKPRVRCYDVDQLAMKFERCLDAEVIKCIVLSDDYSKLLFLESERYVELHSQFGHYYKTRIPKFGRDMEYNYQTCDAYFVGSGSEIYRLNLEVGTFLKPFETETTSLTSIALNPVHNLMVVGSQEGYIEAWDPRIRDRVGRLDCAHDVIRTESTINDRRIPSVSTISFRDGLSMGIGTSTGQILLYDIRTNKPYLTKDHMYGLPIKTIAYLDGPLELIASLDSKIIKLWNRNTGSPYTAIQSDRDLNMITSYPNSGMFFVANESEKILSYYIPSIGPAPKWCSFLDRITEELEESNENTIYDDYKFITEQELEEIGLVDLIGTPLLRAYMHGYFMDMRLYRKARDASNPFAYEEYKKKKIKEKLDSQHTDRVQIVEKLPKVNRTLAERLIHEENQDASKKSKKYKANPMKDDRFSAMFKNPDFQIDELSEEFRLLNPVLSRMSKPVSIDSEKPIYANVFEDDRQDLSSDDDVDDIVADNEVDSEISDVGESDDDDDDDDGEEEMNIPESPKKLKKPIETQIMKTKMFKVQEVGTKSAKVERQTFEQRLRNEGSQNGGKGREESRLLHGGIGGNRVMTFTAKPSSRDCEKEQRNQTIKDRMVEHIKERKMVARKATGFRFTKKSLK